jgi:ankyrin repeat protein
MHFMLSKLNKQFKYQLGMTSLHWAVRKREIELVRIIISRNADLDKLDRGARTALYFACKNSDLAMTKLLLRNRASPWVEGALPLRTLASFSSNPELLLLHKTAVAI